MKMRYSPRFPRGPSDTDTQGKLGAPKREDRSQPPFHTRAAIFAAYYPGATYGEIRCQLQKDFRRNERRRGLLVARRECWPETVDASKEAASRLLDVAERLYWLAKAILFGIK